MQSATEPAQPVRSDQMLLGDEAVALAALHAGVTAAYSYPGTPATEILEYLKVMAADEPVVAEWSANEKTAYEQALGVSYMGRRALVAMKHVGLNVAADPFVNSALVDIGGGLVVVVADDPGMHSSQNEQDTRYLADFARVICMEPASQQDAYDMTREAFDVSERFKIPVVVRLVTRLCHGRSVVATAPRRGPTLFPRCLIPAAWTLIPGNARRQWRALLDVQPDLEAYAEHSPVNVLAVGEGSSRFGVITAGIARNYYLENLADLGQEPAHLHIGVYPPPVEKIRELMDGVDSVLVLEDGYPYLERRLRGLLPGRWEIHGRETGAIPAAGELTPDLVREALGLAPRQVMASGALPSRPPQLCKGCPHSDSYDALSMALSDFPQSAVLSDIGCYALGAVPPYEVIESCVCMGASIGMAKGAADAGLHPSIAVIGDSTFLHSGVTGLMDAVAARTPMTVIILDNQTVAMTGLQEPVLAGSRLGPIVLGVGVDPDHLHIVDIQPHKPDELAAILRKEMSYEGVSVVIAVRECVEAAKRHRREARGR